MKNIAVYPGSFDPCTNGHLDIITRSSKIFDTLYVAVLNNGAKKPAFTVAERTQHLKKVTRNLKNVNVTTFNGLLVKFMNEIGAHVIVKGLRAMSDFEYEFQMALTNNKIDSSIETIFMTTASENSFLSSSMVKEVAVLGGDIGAFVPPEIEQDILKKLGAGV